MSLVLEIEITDVTVNYKLKYCVYYWSRSTKLEIKDTIYSVYSETLYSTPLHPNLSSPQYIDDVVVTVELLQLQVVVLVDPDLLEGLLELTHLVSRGHTEYGRPLLVFHLGQTVIF